MAIPPNTLFQEASCFNCASNASLADLLKLALLQRIVDGGGGGGGCFQCSNGVVPPTNPPASTGQPAQYQDTASGFSYRWDIGTQAWVVIPKVYRALLTQSGEDAPSAIVLENTLIGTPVWARSGVGDYSVNLNNGFSEHTGILCMTSVGGRLVSGFTSDDSCTLFTTIYDDQGEGIEVVAQDNALNKSLVEILVYP